MPSASLSNLASPMTKRSTAAPAASTELEAASSSGSPLAPNTNITPPNVISLAPLNTLFSPLDSPPTTPSHNTLPSSPATLLPALPAPPAAPSVPCIRVHD
ncbi:hypothetical protein H0H92_002206 [Tricholoma furcatifolium]|nr:hypothetical protein H0H92_002206 [Tricholoma furcatifolium]